MYYIRLLLDNVLRELTIITNVVTEIKSAILIDSDDLDNFINQKVLEHHGVTTIVAFKNGTKALTHLVDTHINYDIILVDLHMPILNGFEFIDQFFLLKLNEKHGKICAVTSSINPVDKLICAEKNVKFIEKPLTIEKLLKQTK